MPMKEYVINGYHNLIEWKQWPITYHSYLLALRILPAYLHCTREEDKLGLLELHHGEKTRLADLVVVREVMKGVQSCQKSVFRRTPRLERSPERN